MASSTSSSADDTIATDLSPYVRVYKDGKVERLLVSPFVPPVSSDEDSSTGLYSKDVINISSSQVSARLYLPKHVTTDEKLPILIYYHGGGFCLGSAFDFLTHRYLNLLVSEAKAVGVCVDYRLTPENPLPAAYEDSWTALNWVASHAVADDDNNNKDPWLLRHGNFDQLYLVGDSSGGNIVHNLAIRAASTAESLPGNVKIAGAILSHPFFWGSDFEKIRSTSTSTTAAGAAGNSFYYRLWMFGYPSAPGGIDNSMVNPFILSDNGTSLSGTLACRKLFVCTSEKDDVRESAVLYVEALKKKEKEEKEEKSDGWTGYQVEFVEIEGEGHCFHIYNPYSEKAKNLISRMASFITG